MRDFTLGACSSDRLMKPTTVSTSCRSGWRSRLISRHAHGRPVHARGEVTATSTSCRTGSPPPAGLDQHFLPVSGWPTSAGWRRGGISDPRPI